MECLKCGKESKREFCRECKEKKHNAVAIMSQNRKKLLSLLHKDRLSPEWFEKFVLYANNIIYYWKIYMEYKNVKREKIFRWILKWAYLVWGCIMLHWLISLLIIYL